MDTTNKSTILIFQNESFIFSGDFYCENDSKSIFYKTNSIEGQLICMLLDKNSDNSIFIVTEHGIYANGDAYTEIFRRNRRLSFLSPFNKITNSIMGQLVYLVNRLILIKLNTPSKIKFSRTPNPPKTSSKTSDNKDPMMLLVSIMSQVGAKGKTVSWRMDGSIDFLDTTASIEHLTKNNDPEHYFGLPVLIGENLEKVVSRNLLRRTGH